MIGLGGGSAIADSVTYPSIEGHFTGIGLFNGIASWPIDLIVAYPNYTLTTILLNNDIHPVGRGGLNHYETLYRDGPQFLVYDFSVNVIYNYITTGTPAGIAFTYSQGRVFLAGFQPEFEENDSRDSTDFGQELHDSDSEWDIIERAVKFCLWEL